MTFKELRKHESICNALKGRYGRPVENADELQELIARSKAAHARDCEDYIEPAMENEKRLGRMSGEEYEKQAHREWAKKNQPEWVVKK